MRYEIMLSRTYICTSTMNLWVTGQSQNKWGIVSTVNEQKEHKFESIKPILQVYSLTPNILCNNQYWKYLNLVERLDFNGEEYASFQSKEISFSFSDHLSWEIGLFKIVYQQVVFEQIYRPFEFSLFLKQVYLGGFLQPGGKDLYFEDEEPNSIQLCLTIVLPLIQM